MVTRLTLCISYRVSIYILLFCCAECLWWPEGAFTLYAYYSMSVIYDSLLVFCSSSSSCRLRGLSADITAHGYVKGFSVDCYCPDISYFHSLTVSCPSGLCLSVSLPLVTSQARLESGVLEPQPGVTAGFRRMFQALGGQDRYPAVPSDLPQ